MSVAVVHLVRAPNGLKPFRAFVGSYMQNRAGLSHDLIVVFKGFSRRLQLSPYEKLLKGLRYLPLRVGDFGYDIRAYFIAANRFDYQYFCFLNSYSRILDNDWLAKMHAHLLEDGIGLVGPTGSYESAYSDALRRVSAHLSLHTRVVDQLRLDYYKFLFDPFPNRHIRTNGFVVTRDVIRTIRRRPNFRKLDAMSFESGKNSLTRQIDRMRLRAVVVGKDGKAYEMEDWWMSNTYAQEDQRNLLISDNRTDRYMAGNIEERRWISQAAWGDKSYFAV